MNQRLIGILLALLPGVIAHAQDFDGQAREIPQPDHLVPVAPYAPDFHREYLGLCHELLQVSERETAVMIYMPSFEPEEGLVLRETEGPEPRYELIATRADRSIWYSMPKNNQEHKQRAVKVTRHRAPLPADLARHVCRLWEAMLRGVRYPGPEMEGVAVDGATTEFRWRPPFGGTLHGETWSPTKGSPRHFVELGRSLIEYCDAAEAERAR
ncbi:MAG TPA: hypothetical protein VF590_20230, partial [Isosphaeraceae bacterium]